MDQEYDRVFVKYLQNVKCSGNYRYLNPISKGSIDLPYNYYGEHNKKILNWCTNDYLGISKDVEIVNAAKEALNEFGVGSGGTRNIGGNTHSIMKLEKDIAANHSKESALVFTSGYISNEASITALASIMPDLVIFSDQYNHASMIAGISNSKLQKFIYKHLDMIDLELLLSKVPKSKPKIIIFESVYSMNGFISPVKKICELANRYNALTYIDEVHSVGLYGKYGAGIANMLGLENEIDIIQASLAKSYGTMGGYIASKKNIVDAIRLAARGFIFTTSLPPVITQAAIKSIKLLQSAEQRRILHKRQVSLLKQALKKENIAFLQNDTHIIPIILGSPFLAKEVSDLLLEKYSIFVQHINFPTVPKFTERIRITPTPYHSDDMILYFVQSLSKVIKTLGINLEELNKMNYNVFAENIANVS